MTPYLLIAMLISFVWAAENTSAGGKPPEARPATQARKGAKAASKTLKELIAYIEKDEVEGRPLDEEFEQFGLESTCRTKGIHYELTPNHTRNLRIVYGNDGKAHALLWTEYQEDEKGDLDYWAYKSTIEGELLEAVHTYDTDHGPSESAGIFSLPRPAVEKVKPHPWVKKSYNEVVAGFMKHPWPVKAKK